MVKKLYKLGWWLAMLFVVCYMVAFESRQLRIYDRVEWLENENKRTQKVFEEYVKLVEGYNKIAVRYNVLVAEYEMRHLPEHKKFRKK